MLLEKWKYEFLGYRGWRTRDKLTKAAKILKSIKQTFSIIWIRVFNPRLNVKKNIFERQSEELAHESARKLSLPKTMRVDVKINCEKAPRQMNINSESREANNKLRIDSER